MRALIQRVKEAQVVVDGKAIGAIDEGLLVFLGVGAGDTPENLDYLVRKIIGLRIFTDEVGKMNLSVQQTNRKVLLVSQFTRYADMKKAR